MSITFQNQSLPTTIETFSDHDLVNGYNFITRQVQTLTLENDLFQKYLDDFNITDMDSSDGDSELRISTSRSSGKSITTSFASYSHQGSIWSVASLSPRRPPAMKLSIQFRFDLLDRALEDLQLTEERGLKRVIDGKKRGQIEQEELKERLRELRDNASLFDLICDDDARKLMEKFVKFLTGTLRRHDLTKQKLRLQTNNLTQNLRKVKEQLAFKEELGERLVPADFDELIIINRQMKHELKWRQEHLAELKILAGRSNLTLSTLRKFIAEQERELERLRVDINERRRVLTRLEEKCRVVTRNIERIEGSEDVRRVVRDGVNVTEYVLAKATLRRLRKIVKTVPGAVGFQTWESFSRGNCFYN